MKNFRYPEGVYTELEWVERFADRVESFMIADWHLLIDRRKWNRLGGGQQEEYEEKLKERAKKPFYYAHKGDINYEISKATYNWAIQHGISKKAYTYKR